MYVRQRLSHGSDAPGAAREVLDAMMAGRVDPDQLAELRLVVSELVTNAVRHGRARDGAVELSVTVREGVVRVEVVDAGAGFDPPGEVPDAGEPGGWGLVVVDRLASRWGVDGRGATRVWAELALDTNGTSDPCAAGSVCARNV